MQFHKPDAALSPFISHYWLSHNQTAASHAILPDGCIDVVFEIGATTACRAYGAATRQGECQVASGFHYLGIGIRPGQARHFLQLPAHCLTDGYLPITGMADLTAEALADDIASGHVFHRMDKAFCNWLARRPMHLDPVDWAVRNIDYCNGNARIDSLAIHVGLSQRQLERRFRDAVGLSPKTYAGIQRWRHARALLQARPKLPLVAIAADAGYADQSHMNRDFRRLSGQTPLSQTDVAFFQSS